MKIPINMCCWRFTRWILFFLAMSWPFGALCIEKAAIDPDVNVRLETLGESIDQAISQEQEQLAGLQKELDQLKERETVYKTELATLKVQYSVYSNLVLMSETQVKNLEQGFSGNLSAKSMVNTILADFRQNSSRVKNQLNQTEGQIKLNAGQLALLVSDKKDQTPESAKHAEKLKRLLDTLERKKKVLTRLSTIYDGYYAHYLELEKQFTSLIDDFEREISSRKKQHIFQRKTNLLFVKTFPEMVADLGSLPGRLEKRINGAALFAMGGGLEFSSILTLALMFLFLQYLLFKAYRALRRLKGNPYFNEARYAGMTVQVAGNSLFLAFNLAFLITCDFVFHTRLEIPLLDAVIPIMTTVLLTRWVMNFIKHFPLAEDGAVSADLQRQARQMVRTARYFVIIYILCLQIVDTEHILLVMFRMLMAVTFYIELYRFRKVLMSCMDSSQLPEKIKHVISMVPVAGYGLVFAGLIMELGGYVQLAVFLFVSLSETLVVILWSALFFQNLKEFKVHNQVQADTAGEEAGIQKLSTHWLLTLLYALIWAGFALISITYIWGDRQSVVASVTTFYVSPIQIGTMHFSLKSFTLAIVFLVITHMTAKVWTNLFQKKLITGSGMDIGLQDSISTISVYLIWTAGVLVAMNVFGLDMTSITVVLGALGIGIGFGLQNIFNNFLSGIILLFERPIQVGDDVEVNGTWATVKKINVRSTIVQTYDNATLIIPNSDFISSQVTNWSFKDKRIRRNISVGVAYGSDVALVKSTLLEIADTVPRILRSPKPDVIFRDFGDSALIFILRIWTRVEYFYAVESAVRTEIERQFRERDIQISFPQRDLHIRSVDRDVIFNRGK